MDKLYNSQIVQRNSPIAYDLDTPGNSLNYPTLKGILLHSGIPELRKENQEDHRIKVNLDYIANMNQDWDI
jgi:hypothetical protein